MLRLIFKLAYTAVMLIEALVIGRIVLTVINANTQNTLVSWVLNTSAVFIKPFEGITANALQIDRFTIPLTPLITLLFCIIASFILSELIKAFSRD